MRAKISKWGNSLAVRLPKGALDAAGIKEGETVNLTAVPGAIQIRVAGETPQRQLDELLAEAIRLGPENRLGFVDLGVLPSEWPTDDWSDIAPSDEEMGIGRARHRRKATGGR